METIILGTMFDSSHTAYIFISLAITALMIWLPVRFIRKQSHKDIYLKFWAMATFFLHISPLWVLFLQGDPPTANDNMLFPIYFCNMSMYLLVVAAFWGNKNTRFYGYMATIVGYAGAIGALISLFYPEYYLVSTYPIFEWGIFKSMASHSTMLIGSLYLFFGGYFKVNRYNAVVFAAGLPFFGLTGVIVNWIFALAGLAPVNAMYLEHPPIEDVPFLNVYVITLMMLIVIFIVSFSYEIISKRKSLIRHTGNPHLA